MTVHFQFNTPAFDALLKEMEEDMTSALRPAAQKGAQVYYDALLSEYDRLVKNKTFNLRNAIYQAYRDLDSNDNLQVYGVSWAGRKSSKASQHGHLIEFGHWQPYELVRNKRGEWVTAVQKGAKRPSTKDARHWTQAQRDAYFIRRKGGPKWVAPRPFMRNTMNNQGNWTRAEQAMMGEIFKRFGGGTV